MARTSTPIRIDPDLYAAASAAAATMSRSTAQQLAHWARLGRALEASPDVSVESVAKVLRGDASYDDLGPADQAVVRTAWEERMESLRAGLQLDKELAAAGRPYSELDASGAVVRRGGAPRASRHGSRR